MNYNIRNLIVMLIMLVIFVLLNIKYLKKYNKISKLKNAIYFLIFLILSICPLENLWLRFNSLKGAFEYYYSNENFIDSFEFNENAIVLYGQDNNISFSKFTKVNDKWKLKTFIVTGVKKEKIYNDECFLFYLSPDEKNIVAYIACEDLRSELSDTNKKKYNLLTSSYKKLKSIDNKETIFYDKFNIDDYIYINNDKVYLKDNK